MLIFGYRRTAHRIAVLTLVCQCCRNPTAHVLNKLITRFTLFFIPLFPIGSRHTLTCTYCASAASLTAQQAQHLLAEVQPAPAYPSNHYPPRGYLQGDVHQPR